MSWTDDRVDMLKKLWTEGLTASQIAAKLGGVSRNAVIGKVHRLKLESRANPSKSSRTQPRAATPRPSVPRKPRVGAGGYGTGGSIGAGISTSPAPVIQTTQRVGATVMKAEVETKALAELDTRPVEEVVVPIARKLTLLELNEKTCKYCYGDPLTDDFYFCGHDVDGDSPYCKYHSKLVYQQPQDRRRR
ncbi:MAG: GcrA family cell cycle regulator [Pseudomonadota bacterium]